jgi:hypothetical protein
MPVLQFKGKSVIESYHHTVAHHRLERLWSVSRNLPSVARLNSRSADWVIDCEKLWLHQAQLRAFERQHEKRVRAMRVPFNLK